MQARYGCEVLQDILDRHPILLAKLNYGWKEEGPRIIADDVFQTIDMGKHPWD